MPLVSRCAERETASSSTIVNQQLLQLMRGPWGAALTVLEPAFSTKDATGSILVTVLGMVAEMERRFIRERQQAGIEAAKSKGVYKGRRPSVPVAKVKAMRDEGHGPSAIAKALGISRMSVHRVLTG
jgi:DNA invertase Pin-like site-specific DNA recombinase